MGPESQALVREFNRRLRSALNSAPNHMRVEATLEVESHVCDVLSRGGEGTESEQVARILAGFGSPEAYARALIQQMPEVEAVTLGGSLREVSLAAGDLVRGGSRLIVALLRQVWELASRVASMVWRFALLVLGFLWDVLQRSRRPAGNVARWLWTRGDATFTLAGRAGGMVVHTMRQGAHLGQYALRAGKGAVALGTSAFRLILGLAGWALRAAGLVFLAGVTLLMATVAAISALAPDIIGSAVFHIQGQVAAELEQIRRHTVYTFSPATQVQFTALGNGVTAVALTVTILLVAFWVFLIWSYRRRRQQLANQ